jgi:hypothetical protein
MELSITAVSRNREMTNTLISASSDINGLRHLFEHIDFSSEPFHTLQLVLMDEFFGYNLHIGTKGKDRLYQIKIGTDGMPIGRGKELEFSKSLESIFKKLIPSLPISQKRKDELLLTLNNNTPNKAISADPKSSAVE